MKISQFLGCYLNSDVFFSLSEWMEAKTKENLLRLFFGYFCYVRTKKHNQKQCENKKLPNEDRTLFFRKNWDYAMPTFLDFLPRKKLSQTTKMSYISYLWRATEPQKKIETKGVKNIHKPLKIDLSGRPAKSRGWQSPTLWSFAPLEERIPRIKPTAQQLFWPSSKFTNAKIMLSFQLNSKQKNFIRLS